MALAHSLRNLLAAAIMAVAIMAWPIGGVSPVQAATGETEQGSEATAEAHVEGGHGDVAHGDGAHGDVAHGDGAHGAGEHDVLPQLDVATFPSQIVWLIITFILLYWLMKTKALPRVAEILEARQDRIANDLDKAAMYRRDAEKALEQYENEVARAQAESQAKMKKVQEQLAKDHAEQERKLDAELAAKVEKAESEIHAARDQALAEINSVAAETAKLATQKLIGIDVTDDEAKAALERVMQEAA